MTRSMIKLENELKEELFRLAKKYGYKELCCTGTIDPKYYKIHRKAPTPGLSILFYNNREK